MNWYLAPVIIVLSEFTGKMATQVSSNGVEHFPESSRAHVGRATDVPTPTHCLVKTALPANDWILVSDFETQFATLFGRIPLDNEK